jgi:hypothetical protein
MAEKRYREALELSYEQQFYSLAGTARSVLWQRNVDAYRPLVVKLDADPYAGPWAASARIAFHGGLDALEGRTTDAIAGYRTAIDRLTDDGWIVDAVRATTDAVHLLGRRPEFEAQIRRAQTVIAELRLKPFGERLDHALAASSAANVDRSVTERAGTPV